jgi:hypothetical protein
MNLISLQIFSAHATYIYEWGKSARTLIMSVVGRSVPKCLGGNLENVGLGCSTDIPLAVLSWQFFTSNFIVSGGKKKTGKSKTPSLDVIINFAPSSPQPDKYKHKVFNCLVVINITWISFVCFMDCHTGR